jgi:PAS domain S-box-containing protein
MKRSRIPGAFIAAVLRMEALDYRRLFETAPGLTVILDRDLRIVAASDAFLAATMTRRETIVGQDLFRVFPTDPERPGFRGEHLARELLARVLREGTPQRLTLQRYDVPRPATAGGGFERRYWTALFAPFAGSDGVAHIVCTVEDVTDRGRDAGLATAVSVDAIGIVFFDRRGTLISANDTFLRWTGFTRQDLAAETVTWRTLTPPEYVAASEEQLARLDATGRTGPYEKEYFTKDGRRVWMLFVGARLEDGSLVEYVIDISDRKAAERERREVEERYRTLFDSLDAGFCVIEMVYDTHGRPSDYRFIEVNQAFERQTGLRDATANSMREHAPEHEQHWFDIYARIAETGESARFIEEARALGFWYEVFAFRVGAEAGRRVGILFYDITERVRAQRALQEEARRKDEFLATLAHELRNPLAPIRNAVALLHYRHGANEDLQSAANLIDRQVTQLARLVDDLLDVSRIRFGKVQLQRAPIDLREVAKDAVATSEPVLAAARHRLHLDLGTEPVWVDADRVRLAQVIANLLNNAARYTPPGGRIRLEVSHGENEASIAVQDNGIGIEPALLERVFEPFAQLETREALASGGIGIGLSLAKALIELHGGHIGAQSAGAGRGSRFVASLPLASAPKPTAAAANGASKPARRLLVVDDNVDAAASQAALLRVLGHEVEVAYDGETALEKARSFRPEIVLLDLGMPGMDGYEVARRLRASEAGRELKLVAQTGWAQEEDRRRTREAGFDAHLAKPVDVTLLQQVL